MAKFQDMPIGERARWLTWANQHDWSQASDAKARYDDATGEMVTFADEITEMHGTKPVWALVEARHKTPAEMRAWAGY